MNVLIVGAGQGSWAMRGVQLGDTIGARVTSDPTDQDVLWSDVVVLVKRAGEKFAQMVHRLTRPIVWDAVDFWRQPSENQVTETHARALLANQLAVIRPMLTIGATRAMADACDGAYVPHHSWANLTPAPVRVAVQTVAYQGNESYLGRWRGWIAAECEARGWAFLVNPTDLRSADLIVALRDGPWDGWICREWKSGVKIANAIAAGRPILTQHSAAHCEMGAVGPIVESQSQLSGALDAWESLEARSAAVTPAMLELAKSYTLETIAAGYLNILSTRRAQWAA